MVDQDKLQKFINDPDWREVEKLFQERIGKLRDIMDVERSGRTAEEIGNEVIGRQLSIEGEEEFLQNAGILRQKQERDSTTFR